MARMIPPTIHSSCKSDAERFVFRQIERAPQSDDWVCLHSLGLARHDRKRRAEIDFLLLCPEGVFVLEVKGGRIQRREGRWFTGSSTAQKPLPESPFTQASSAMFSLGKRIEAHFGDDPLARPYLGYGVVFPHVPFDSIGIEESRELIYDRSDRTSGFHHFLHRLASFTHARDRRRGISKLDSRGIERLVDFLRGDFDLVPTMDVFIEQAKDEVARLTSKQQAVLDHLSSEPRLIIEGAAGSGKSLLAVEAAKRAAREGKRVLFLCYNSALAHRLSALVENEEMPGQVRVSTLHYHYRRTIEASEVFPEFQEVAADADNQVLFEEHYPVYAGFAWMGSGSPRYEVLILDEAQDILTERHLEVLDEMLSGGLKEGTWRFFLDSNNQANVYGRFDRALFERLSKSARVQFLPMNCRNTRPIELSATILANPKTRSTAEIDGSPVDYLPYDPKRGPLPTLRRALSALEDEKVPPGQVSVLFTRRPTENVIEELGEMGLNVLEDEDAVFLGTNRLPKVTYSTVSGFKGLENDVIVLVGLDQVGSDWSRSIAYVGMTRARVRLFVILTDRCNSERERLWAEELQRQVPDAGVTE